MVSLRRSSRPRYGPCSSRTWGRRYALARRYCTVGRSLLAWPFCDDGSGVDRCVSWNGVALALPWQKTLKKHYQFDLGSLGNFAKLRKLWPNDEIVKP